MSAPRLSQTIAKVLLSQGPYHAWHAHRDLGGVGKKPTAVMDFGTLTHELILGGERVLVFDFKDWKKNEAKQARVMARAFGKVPVLRKVYKSVTPLSDKMTAKMAEAGIVRGDPRWHFEERIQWDHGGVPCEGTPDVWGILDGMMEVIDPKSSKTYDPKRVNRTAAMEWAIQMAAYLDGLRTRHPEWAGRQRWRWLLGEQSHPHDVRWAYPDGGLKELGESQWMRAVEWWGRLLELGWATPWKSDDLQLEASTWAVAEEQLRNEEDATNI